MKPLLLALTYIIISIFLIDVSTPSCQKVYNGNIFHGSVDNDGFPPSDMVTEGKIYEALFLHFSKGKAKEFYLANTTENQWVTEYPRNRVNWSSMLKDLGGISMDLVQQLYILNKSNRPIHWDSSVLKPIFLPEEYANHDSNAECLVERGKGNTGWSFDFIPDVEWRTYYSVSRVAFSLDREYALVKFSKRCEPLFAGEGFYSFKFTGGRWKVIGEAYLWWS